MNKKEIKKWAKANKGEKFLYEGQEVTVIGYNPWAVITDFPANSMVGCNTHIFKAFNDTLKYGYAFPHELKPIPKAVNPVQTFVEENKGKPVRIINLDETSVVVGYALEGRVLLQRDKPCHDGMVKGTVQYTKYITEPLNLWYEPLNNISLELQEKTGEIKVGSIVRAIADYDHYWKKGNIAMVTSLNSDKGIDTVVDFSKGKNNYQHLDGCWFAGYEDLELIPEDQVIIVDGKFTIKEEVPMNTEYQQVRDAAEELQKQFLDIKTVITYNRDGKLFTVVILQNGAKGTVTLQEGDEFDGYKAVLYGRERALQNHAKAQKKIKREAIALLEAEELKKEAIAQARRVL